MESGASPKWPKVTGVTVFAARSIDDRPLAYVPTRNLVKLEPSTGEMQRMPTPMSISPWACGCGGHGDNKLTLNNQAKHTL